MTKMPVAVLGIDLGKTSCSLAGLDERGAVVLRRRMTRRHGGVRGQACGLRGRYGGLMRGALPRPVLQGAGSRGVADVAGVRATPREGAEDR